MMDDVRKPRFGWQDFVADWVVPLVPWLVVPLFAAVILLLLGSNVSSF
jgi:hypothetical protein